MLLEKFNFFGRIRVICDERFEGLCGNRCSERVRKKERGHSWNCGAAFFEIKKVLIKKIVGSPVSRGSWSKLDEVGIDTVGKFIKWVWVNAGRLLAVLFNVFLYGFQIMHLYVFKPKLNR